MEDTEEVREVMSVENRLETEEGIGWYIIAGEEGGGMRRFVRSKLWQNGDGNAGGTALWEEEDTGPR